MFFLAKQMVKELCHRCSKPVYPTDKVGPLKDSTFFHQGCFKCYICGTRLALKTYCNNRNDINDQVNSLNKYLLFKNFMNLIANKMKWNKNEK